MKNKPPCIEWADKIGLRCEDLSPQEHTSLNEHLQTCEFCRDARRDYDFLTARVRALPPPIVKPLPRLSLPLYEMDENQMVDRHSFIRHQPYKRILSRGLLLASVVIVLLPLLLFFQYRARLGVQVPIGTTITTYNGHSNWVHALVWSQDKEIVASVANDYVVQVWNANNAKTLFTAHTGSPSAITLSPNGKEVAFVEQDQADKFVVKDIRTGKELFACKDTGTSITLLAWSPDGQKIVSADDAGNIQIWSVKNKSSILDRSYDSVSALAWSPDSNRLGLGNFQGEVAVMDVQSDLVITKYTAHAGAVSSVTWSPDGTRIASASFDTTVRVWDARNGQTLFV